MNVLVIGGNRFFGKTLVNILASEKHHIWVMNRGNQKVTYPKRASHIVADRSDTQTIKSCIEHNDIDLVYDQVLFDSFQAQEVVDMLSSLDCNIPNYVFTSSQSVYGSGMALSESDFKPELYSYPKPVKGDEDYSEAKKQAEAVFFKSSMANKIAAVRFPIVIGSDDYTGRFAFHVEALEENKEIFFPNTEASISFIHSDDAAICLYELGKKFSSGPINMCTPKPIKLRNFLNLLEDAVGGEFTFGNDPHRNYSPYAIGSDWWMDTEKMQSMGVRLKEIPEAVTQILREMDKSS